MTMNERECMFEMQRDILRIRWRSTLFASCAISPKVERHFTQPGNDLYSGLVTVIRHSRLTEGEENVSSRYGIKEAFVGRRGIDPSRDGTARAVASRKSPRGKHW